jgi:hypothetical protein
VTDWLERTLGSDSVKVTRATDTLLEFRSGFKPFDSNRSGDSLTFLANGEIEVMTAQDGPQITVRANPHIMNSAVPGVLALVWLSFVFGWANVSSLLGWGAGLGGIVLGGVSTFLTWGSINTFLLHKAEILRMLRTRPESPRETGAA